MSSPRVALLVPCYNAEPYLDDFITNMSQQTRPFDEVWFYDDMSTDRTAAMLAKQTFGKFVIGTTRSGPAIGRNAVLQRSTSEVVHFHDVDDWLEPTFLERALAEMTPDTDVVICNVGVVDRDTGKKLHEHDYSGFNTANDPTGFFLTHCCFPINGLYRRSVLEQVGGFHPELWPDEDPDLHIRLANHGARFKIIGEPLAINRFGPGTHTYGSYIKCHRAHLKALRLYRDLLPNRYLPLLRSDAARRAGMCAHGQDLNLALDYVDFCQAIGGGDELWRAQSRPMKPLVKLLGCRRAFQLRFGPLGTGLRRLWPGQVG